jgi:hypothetical protein
MSLTLIGAITMGSGQGLRDEIVMDVGCRVGDDVPV